MERKGEDPEGRGRGGGRGRGKGRGRGRGRNNQSQKQEVEKEKVSRKRSKGKDSHEAWENWSGWWDGNGNSWGQWSPEEWAEWEWDQECARPKDQVPKRARKPVPAACSAQSPPKKSKRKNSESKAASETAPQDKKQRKRKENVAKPEPLPPAPETSKELKQEVLGVLNFSKDLTEDNAREELRKLVPDFTALGYDSKLNIYWVRRGVKGVGVGVTSKSEGLDYGFFGFKVCCDNWIYAIAAAIKAAELLATFLHTGRSLYA